MTRKDKSLFQLTKQVIDILQTKHGPVTMKELADLLCKRRCYDIILVLEAVGKVERVGKKKDSVRWCDDERYIERSESFDPFDDEFIDKIFEY